MCLPISIDGEGGLANREELLKVLLGKEDEYYNNEDDNWEDEMFGSDEFDPAGGRGLSSHMESVAEQKLRSVIYNIIKEELNENFDKYNMQVISNDYEGTIKRDEEGWMMYDEDNNPEEAGPFNSLESLMSHYDLTKNDLHGDYVKNLR